jgi:hypothetical protein
MLTVTATNVSRLPIAVTNWDIAFGPIFYSLPDAPNSPRMPHVLGVGEQATWHVPLHELLPTYLMAEHHFGEIERLRARVVLAGGRIVESPIYPSLSDEAVAAVTRRPRVPERNAECEARAAFGGIGGVDRAALVSEETGCDREDEACSVAAGIGGPPGADDGFEEVA